MKLWNFFPLETGVTAIFLLTTWQAVVVFFLFAWHFGFFSWWEEGKEEGEQGLTVEYLTSIYLYPCSVGNLSINGWGLSSLSFTNIHFLFVENYYWNYFFRLNTHSRVFFT